MGFLGAWPWNDRHYADVSDRQGPDINNIVSACFHAPKDINMKHAGQVFTLGPAGFEPTTCRRGDRSTNSTRQVRRGLAPSSNTALFSPLRSESRSFPFSR